jgi:hypothetical protein
MSQPIWLRELALFSLFIWFSDPHSKSVWVTIIPILLTGKPRYREVKKPRQSHSVRSSSLDLNPGGLALVSCSYLFHCLVSRTPLYT